MSRSAQRSARALAAAAFATLLAACGGDGATGPNGGATGRFSGNVAGHVTRAISGVAFYAQVNQDGDAGFGIGMGALAADQKTFTDMIIVGREKAGVPGPGSYTLHNSASGTEPTADQFVLTSTLQMPNGGELFCSSTTGTLTLEAASGGRLKGSYSTQASCVNLANPDAEVSVTLSGSFEAVASSRLP
jgi:hypothetical protein